MEFLIARLEFEKDLGFLMFFGFMGRSDFQILSHGNVAEICAEA